MIELTPEVAFVEAQHDALNRYGVVAERRWLSLPTVSGQAHVLVAGNGPAVVLINGIGCPAAMWAPLISELADFTVYAVDLPGFGLTETGRDFVGELPGSATAFLEDVITELGLDRPAMVTNSLGSLLAMRYALNYPDRVSAMAHIGCPALAPGTSAPLQMRMLSVSRLGRALLQLDPPSEAQVRRLSKMVKQYPLDPTIGELLLRTELLANFEDNFLGTLQLLLRIRGARPELAIPTDQLADLHVPTLFVFGHDDPMGGPAVGRKLAAALPQAELIISAGGHAPWLNHSDKIGPPVASFLAANSKAASDATPKP